MLLTAFQMLHLLPRQILLRLTALAIAGVVLFGAGVAPAHAKTDPEVKRIKKLLIEIQNGVDTQTSELRRLGDRWDDLEERTAMRSTDLSGFVSTSLGAAEQAHIETLILHAREAIVAFEDAQEETIADLEKIVAERQAKKLEKSGLTAAAMPSISINGSLVTYSADWEKTAMCESTKRWHIDSRYDGGLQFDPITWIEFGGAEFARYAWQVPKMQQIAVAERVLAIQGPGAWPLCFHPLPADAEG
jgi:hypothetical protein